MILITLALTLTVYQEDAATVPYLFLMQVTLYFSHKNRGRETRKQLVITLLIMLMLVLLAVAKGVLFGIYNKKITKEEYTGA